MSQTPTALQGSLNANADKLIEEAQKNPAADVDSSAFDFTASEAPAPAANLQALKNAAHAKIESAPVAAPVTPVAAPVAVP